MIIKHPKFTFLNENPNPTFEEVFHWAKKWHANQAEEERLELMLFFLSELLQLKEPIEKLENKISAEAFTIEIMFQSIGCCGCDGLGIGIFGNYPELVPHLPKALREVGCCEIAGSIDDVIAVFPACADFSKRDDLYYEILNFMENPKRKTTEPLLEDISAEEKQRIHGDYIKTIEIAETLMEEQLLPNDFRDGYIVLESYYKRHKTKQIYKPQRHLRDELDL